MESSAEEQENSWITNFCSQRGHEYFCQVDRNYVEDGFNLYGLKSMVDNFGECLDIILDRIDAGDESDAASADEVRATTELYGLIHARYIVTNHGLDAMHTKYLRRDFGTCPRYYCDNYPILPLGMNDALGVARVNTYCPRCRQVFRPLTTSSLYSTLSTPGNTAGPTTPGSNDRAVADHIDGAYFGTTFAHLFLMTFGFPRGAHSPLEDEVYVPRVFGFKLHPSAYQRAGGSIPVGASTLAAVDPSRYGRKRPRTEEEDNLNQDAITTTTRPLLPPHRNDQSEHTAAALFAASRSLTLASQQQSRALGHPVAGRSSSLNDIPLPPSSTGSRNNLPALPQFQATPPHHNTNSTRRPPSFQFSSTSRR